ncbi:probable L-cysteine desulfhydrase, chloroplastic [Tanacetum coccineum]
MLQHDIDLSTSKFDFNVNKKAEEGVTFEMENTGNSRNQAYEEIFDRESNSGWTYEMIDFYKARIAKCGLNENQYFKRMKRNEDMEDEVGGDTSSHAVFMTQDVVLNTVDASMADMVNNDDAVGLGPCLVILMVMGNSNFFELFGPCYANFLPYVTSNHCPALLVMFDITMKKRRAFRFMNYLFDKKDFHKTVKDHWCEPIKGYAMFVFAKRLKGMKRHLRDLNKKNGNVHDKVKVLREELKKVQFNLDKDPSNLKHREDEMLLNNAYREVTLDEARILKQKYKVDWLKEGDHNTAFFHNMLKGRKNKSRIVCVKDDMGNEFLDDEVAGKFVSYFQTFLGSYDDIFPIDMPEDLFSKKVDAESALHMVRDLSEDEIKVALFDIKDDKAPGPDVFTSKFFKAYWNIVGDDLCAAIQEFFKSGKMLGELNTTLIFLVPKCILPSKTMVNWIMICLKSASFSICVNGESHGFFKAKRGLRQGDPVFPYLFTIVMEVSTLMVSRQVKNEKKFKYDWGCKDLKILNLCFADNLMMFCHGDKISAFVMRRALDELCLSSSLRPSMAKSTMKVEDWRNKTLSFAGRLQLITLVLSSLNPYWASIFTLPIGVCNDVDKLLKKFLWNSGGQNGCKHSVAWKDVCMQKCDGGLVIKWVKNTWLKNDSIWAVEPKKLNSWGWKQILALKDKIRSFVHYKVGNGRKVVDLVLEDRWQWPRGSKNRFKEVLNIQVPKLINDVDDKTIWVNKKGKEKVFNVKEVWKGIKRDVAKVIWYKHVWFSQCMPRQSFILWMAIKGRLKIHDRYSRWLNIQDMYCPLCKQCKDSYNHLFFNYIFSRRIWERLKGMSNLGNVSNSWAQVISSIVIIPAKNTIWNVIQRLVLGASVYFIWQERNNRLFGGYSRIEDIVFKLIVDIVRYMIMRFKLKVTNDVINAADIWNFPIDKTSRVFMEGLWKWCSMNRWPFWTFEMSAFKSLGPWKTGWCCSDLVSVLLGPLECPYLVDCSPGFLSVGLIMKLQDMWNGKSCPEMFSYQLHGSTFNMKFDSMFPRYLAYGDVLNCADWSQYGLVIQRTTSRLRPYYFTYPERELTMEEILQKFIDEGKRKHEEMRAFLLRIIESPPTSNCEIKGVTTRGGKTTTQDIQKEDTNMNGEEPPEEAHDKLVESNEVVMENQH